MKHNKRIIHFCLDSALITTNETVLENPGTNSIQMGFSKVKVFPFKESVHEQLKCSSGIIEQFLDSSGFNFKSFAHLGLMTSFRS